MISGKQISSSTWRTREHTRVGDAKEARYGPSHGVENTSCGELYHVVLAMVVGTDLVDGELWMPVRCDVQHLLDIGRLRGISRAHACPEPPMHNNTTEMHTRP